MASSLNVLIIDDSVSECLYMSQVLQKAGYQVSTVGDGREGLARIMQECPQCLILDIVLPSMNGYEICRYLRSHVAFNALPIIMVSTKNTIVDRNWGLRQGANRYLIKPFGQEALLTAVKELLSQAGYAPPLTSSHEAAHPASAGSRRAPLRPTHTGVHAAVRAADPQTAIPPLLSLIPRRIDPTDPSWINGDGLSFFGDKTFWRVSDAIDDRMSVERICLLTQLPLTHVRRALRTLVEQRRIQLCTATGQKIDAALLLKEY